MTKEKVKTVYDDIVISATDSRKYRGLLLHNEMKVLLISDPVTEKASAAMDVHIGLFILCLTFYQTTKFEIVQIGSSCIP